MNDHANARMTPPTAHVKTPGNDTKLMSVILNSTHAIAAHLLCDTLLRVPFNTFLSVLMLTQEALQHMLRLPLRLAFVETSFLQQRTWTAGLGARSGGFLHLQGFGDTASLGLDSLVIDTSLRIGALSEHYKATKIVSHHWRCRPRVACYTGLSESHMHAKGVHACPMPRCIVCAFFSS